MNFSTTPSLDGGLEVSVGGELVISSVGALKSALAEAWNGQTPLRLSLDEVERIDSAGLQLLLALAEAGGAALRLTRCSAAVRGLIDLYRVGDRLAVAPAHSEYRNVRTQ